MKIASLAILLLMMCIGCGGDGAKGGSVDPVVIGAVLIAQASGPSVTPPYGTTAPSVFTDYSAPADAEYREEFWSNGSLKHIGYVKDAAAAAIPVGPHQTWHENGVLASEGHYDDNGHRDGFWHYWHDNNQQNREAFFVDDEHDGSKFWVERDRNGLWLGGANSPSM